MKKQDEQFRGFILEVITQHQRDHGDIPEALKLLESMATAVCDLYACRMRLLGREVSTVAKAVQTLVEEHSSLSGEADQTTDGQPAIPSHAARQFAGADAGDETLSA